MAVAGMALKAGYLRRQGPDVNPQRKTSDGVQHLLLNDQFSQFRVQFLLTTASRRTCRRCGLQSGESFPLITPSLAPSAASNVTIFTLVRLPWDAAFFYLSKSGF